MEGYWEEVSDDSKVSEVFDLKERALSIIFMSVTEIVLREIVGVIRIWSVEEIRRVILEQITDKLVIFEEDALQS